MHDFHMSALANDRTSSFRAEADRQRLARAAHKPHGQQPSTRRLTTARLGLGFLRTRLA